MPAPNDIYYWRLSKLQEDIDTELQARLISKPFDCDNSVNEDACFQITL